MSDETETVTACEMATSYDPPALSPEETTARMVKIFEQEMRLGSNINNHIPNFILAGLEQLRSIPSFGQVDESEPTATPEVDATPETNAPAEEEKKVKGKVTKEKRNQ